MQARIFILEDNNDRIAFFKKLLPTKFAQSDITIVKTAKEAKSILKKESYWDIILLDHDLGGKVYVDSSKADTGYQVALHMRDKKVKYGQCITHTQNSIGGKNIVSVLDKCQHIPFPKLANLLESA